MKLASIERIKSLSPIAGADRIELAKVLGFNTVVVKGEFKVGDLCVFHVPDTVVNPNNPKYNFLEKQGYRLKISRFKGVYSQGLAMPLSIVGEHLMESLGKGWQPMEGDDVTAIVGITKYEKPLPEGSEAIGPLPSHLRKTDEPNILTAPHLLDALKGKRCYGTLKMDGQSASYYIHQGKFGVCSRNQELRETPGSPFWQIAREINLEQIMRAYGTDFALQGELYGPGIQGNRMGATKKQIAFFNHFDSVAHTYGSRILLEDICGIDGLPIVEIVWKGVFDFSIEELQAMADGLRYSNGAPAEGIVFRPYQETTLENGDRLSAKIISQKFLSKYGE